MARRYIRDKLGRFASKRGKIKSVRAHDTKVAGRLERLSKGSRKLIPTPRLPMGNSGMTKTQLTRRVQRMYKGDPKGLKSDIRVTRRRRGGLDDLLGI